MKTISVNVSMILSMLITFLAFYSSNVVTDPKIILWMTAAGSALSMVLKYFFPSGTWKGTGASASFWTINIIVFVSAVVTSWGGLGIIGAATVSTIVGTFNILLSFLGYTQNKIVK